MKPGQIAAMLVLSAIWGGAFLFIRVVVRDVPPVTVVAGRLAIAALVLAPLAARRGGIMPPRRAWPALIFLSAFNNVLPFSLITAAEQHVSGSLAATLVATMPLFTLIFAVAGRTERPSTEKVAGLIIGFVGTAVLIGADVTDLTDSNTLAEFAVIAASACYAISTVVARQTSRGAPLSLASGQMIFGVMMAAPLALVIDGRPDFGISAEAGASWLALGLLSSGLAYVIFFTLVQSMTATQVAVVTYLVPVVATALGWLLLGESVGPNLVIGLVLVIAGVAATNGALRLAWERARFALAGAGPT